MPPLPPSRWASGSWRLRHPPPPRASCPQPPLHSPRPAPRPPVSAAVCGRARCPQPTRAPSASRLLRPPTGSPPPQRTASRRSTRIATPGARTPRRWCRRTRQAPLTRAPAARGLVRCYAPNAPRACPSRRALTGSRSRPTTASLITRGARSRRRRLPRTHRRCPYRLPCRRHPRHRPPPRPPHPRRAAAHTLAAWPAATPTPPARGA